MRPYPPTLFRTLLLFPLLFLVSACGSNGGFELPDVGETTIAFTDAASDEVVVFEVDVSDIVFTKAGGSTVSLLARQTRVDFADLASVAELIVGVGLEAGRYESGPERWPA